jgi:hypothetical protein
MSWQFAGEGQVEVNVVLVPLAPTGGLMMKGKLHNLGLAIVMGAKWYITG